MTTQTPDRSELDRLHLAATEAIRERDALDGCTMPKWYAAHDRAREACRAERVERARLWKLDRWGAWMNDLDRELATISGELY